MPRQVIFVDRRGTIRIKQIPVLDTDFIVMRLVTLRRHRLNGSIAAKALCGCPYSRMVFANACQQLGCTLVIDAADTLIFEMLRDNVTGNMRISYDFLAVAPIVCGTEINIKIVIDRKMHFAYPWLTIGTGAKGHVYYLIDIFPDSMFNFFFCHVFIMSQQAATDDI